MQRNVVRTTQIKKRPKTWFLYIHFDILRKISYSLVFDVNPERIERFLEGQAFLRSYGSAPRPPPLPSVSWAGPATHRKTEKEMQYADVRGGGGDVEPKNKTGRKQSLALYKSFNPLCMNCNDCPRKGDIFMFPEKGHFLCKLLRNLAQYSKTEEKNICCHILNTKSLRKE
jgi:hypothetical protein